MWGSQRDASKKAPGITLWGRERRRVLCIVGGSVGEPGKLDFSPYDVSPPSAGEGGKGIKMVFLGENYGS